MTTKLQTLETNTAKINCNSIINEILCHIPMILSDALQAKAKRVVLE